MRLRHPPEPAPTIPQTSRQSFTESFNVELITPLYGGGIKAGHPDIELPFRAAAIRGQLRFWWRLLNRDSYPDSTDLFRKESSIFGGMANNSGATASRVFIWVTDIRANEPKTCATYETKDGKPKGPNWNKLPGYALFPGQGQPKEGKAPAKILFPPASFRLHVAINGDDAQVVWDADILPALRWWASFGGLGARTRRGLGSIRISNLHAVTQEDILKKTGFIMVPRTELSDPQAAWVQAIDKLSRFRQGAGTARRGGNPPGRSYWPEPDSIRDITGCHLRTAGKTHTPVHLAIQSFPRAAFGLPIITQFKDGPRPTTPPAGRTSLDPGQTILYPEVSGDKKDRMASPLILKAMWTGNGYAPVALLLPHPHINTMAIKLENSANASNPNLPQTLSNENWWSARAADAMTGSPMDNPLRGRTGDVLNDFMEFYRR